jgi:hypothetical protein
VRTEEGILDGELCQSRQDFSFVFSQKKMFEVVWRSGSLERYELDLILSYLILLRCDLPSYNTNCITTSPPPVARLIFTVQRTSVTMSLISPTLNLSFFADLCSSNFAPATLVDTLSELEATAQLEASKANPANLELFSTYYTVYLLSLILDNDP